MFAPDWARGEVRSEGATLIGEGEGRGGGAEAVRARDLVRNRRGIAGVGAGDDARRRVERDAGADFRRNAVGGKHGVADEANGQDGESGEHHLLRKAGRNERGSADDYA